MNTKFYTGKGDDGESNMGDKNISKSSLYAETIGSLDELTSWLGVVRATIEDQFVADSVMKIQKSLFIIQAEVGALGADHKPDKIIPEDRVKMLESIIKRIDQKVPEITHFVIPGGTKESAVLDFGRTLARRAERKVVAFKKKNKVSENSLQFMNRLSSTLFALARYMNYKKGEKEETPDYK
ncbi:MAG TPA: cob(I)yrinic acid a,c-diamide adenosyltransferase [Candidatus Paceibacterota bacterium]|nr:cob(I)yrinic acid a,c-diamide adenosyltransferase [Candidatus Paceibacterota bacterium]